MSSDEVRACITDIRQYLEDQLSITIVMDFLEGFT